MTVTVATLADRVLRRLGVVIVAEADRPASTATVTVPTIAAAALQRLGVIVPDSDRPANTATVTVASIAASALQRLGVIVPASARPGNTATVDPSDIAASALQRLGVIVPAADRTPVTAITALTDLGTRVLETLGVIASDEAPSSDDLNTATTAIQALNDSMLARGLVAWEADAILESASEEYTQLGAIYLAPAFGKAADVSQRPVIEARISRIALVANAQAMAETKVAEVIAGMVARGILDRTDIPASAAEEYIQMTAGELATVFGQDAPDPALRPALEARVGRVTLVANAQAIAEAQVVELTASMIARGILDRTDIPASAAEEYVQMTAGELAPVFGEDAPDPALRPALEARVARITLVANAQGLAEAKVAELSASMIARGLVGWTDIPASAAEQYIQITALALAPLFGQEADPKLFEMLEERIRQISVIARAPEDAQDAVMAVHGELASADKVRWSVFDIPPAAENPYVVKATNRLAMSFEAAVDARAEAAADAVLARIIALPTSGEVTRVEYF